MLLFGQPEAAAVQYARQVKHPWRNIFRPQYRPELIMAIMIPFFQQVTGACSEKNACLNVLENLNLDF